MQLNDSNLHFICNGKRRSIKIKHVYILSAAIMAISAIFSAGYYHFDEHFQILEFAGLKLNMTVADNLPWEYSYRMRPAIQPAMVVFIFKLFNAFGVNDPFIVATFLRFLSAGLAFTGMFLIYKSYFKNIKDNTLQIWFLVLSFFLWLLIFDSVRFSSENWSGSIFLISIAILKIRQNPNMIFYLYLGMLLGLSFLFRYQTAFLIMGLVLWLLFIRKSFGNTLILITGLILLLGAGILIDRWFYGEWTVTAWNYFDQNILKNRVSDFGILPWWYYIERTFIQGIPPFSIIYILSFFLLFIFRRNELLTWILFPFIIIHFIIGHKEIRFLFPIIGFIPIVIIKSAEIIQAKWNEKFTKNRMVRLFARSFIVVNLILLMIISFSPADGQISLYRKVYSAYDSPATMYYTKDNPYNRVLDINFYKRANLEIVEIDAVSKIDFKANRKLLFVTKDNNSLNELRTQKRLVYSSYPEWISLFNFNNWISRTNSWYVYELY